MAPKSNSQAGEKGPLCELLPTDTPQQLIATVDEGNSTPGMLCPEQSSPNSRTRADGSEAVCRICFVELSEGESFRMDCCCKGDLAAAHSDCAAKWFTIRGKRSCDICGHNVRNLSMLLEKTNARFDFDAGRRHELEEDEHELISYVPWTEAVAVYLSCLLAALWRKLEELSEFP